MGYSGFAGLLANEIFEKMVREWKKVPPAWACEFANTGGLAIAAVKGHQHGHVAVVFPGATTIYSGKWKEEAPLVANVGQTCGIMGANYAFKEKPSYFIRPIENLPNLQDKKAS